MVAALTALLPKAPSLWLEQVGPLIPRDPLDGSIDADVAIVGGGFTGLWTAHHLARFDPSLRIVVIERDVAGWGASGRNGGWCSALYATSWSGLAKDNGADATLRLRSALIDEVGNVGEFCSANGIAEAFHLGGTLTLARGPAQLESLRSDWQQSRRWEPETTWLDSTEAGSRIAASNVDGAVFAPHCATIQPAILVRTLAEVVESQRVRIVEQTRVTRIDPGVVTTDRGDVKAPIVVRALEAYAADLPTSRRVVAPVWSLIVATEPIDDDTWSSIGWSGRETISDGRHLLVYAQRSADGRIVFGGRGAPYRFGSQSSGQAGHERAFRRLEAAMRELLPQLDRSLVTHRWSGVLGVPRDWQPSVGFDRHRGIAWAGGYVGDGVTCAALAGRTLADLIVGRDSELASLPWVGHQSPAWEPEPLRWLGIRGAAGVMRLADRIEQRTGKPSQLATLAGRVIG